MIWYDGKSRKKEQFLSNFLKRTGYFTRKKRYAQKLVSLISSGTVLSYSINYIIYNKKKFGAL